MREDLAARVAVVSLNTRGIALAGSRLAERYAAIGAALDAGDADVVCFQEVLTWLRAGLVLMAGNQSLALDRHAAEHVHVGVIGGGRPASDARRAAW